MKLKSYYNNFKIYLKRIFDDEKVNDFLDMIKFIIIHGTMGMFILFIVVSVIGIDFAITQIIRDSPIYTALVFLIGSGSAYYMTMDMYKFYKEIKNEVRR